MHPTQLEILDSLRQESSRKFSQLLSDVAETSDNLTYHLKRLVQAGLVESIDKGDYRLAQKGIIYLNNNLELNHDLFPTLSCMLELTDTEGRVLVMKKLKQPYLGSNHLPTFGVVSDQSIDKQISEFFEKYQIQATNISYKCNYRERVQDKDSLYIFDKLFVVFSGTLVSFMQSIEDREFLKLAKADLLNDAATLPATKAVIDLKAGAGFVEDTRQLT